LTTSSTVTKKQNRKSDISIEAAAKKLLGFPSLRPGQGEAISALLDGRDVVVVQPTGSGKSAIYQISGELIGGATVIISPLIALQKDQADSIDSERKLKDPVVVNSTQSVSEQREIIERIEEGEAKYIFLAPEQLRKRETIEMLQSGGVSLFVVDEAHCVSQWGHDFRPDYLQLSLVIEALGHPPVLAMTATASNEVRQELIERLGLRKPMVMVQGFDRPNISLRVDTFGSVDDKFEALMRRVSYADTPGIVYVSTHKHAESIAKELQQRGIDAVFYHGGMKAKERDAIQDRFMSGDAPVIVATNAFGMGVDKPDIRFVYHADVGESLDSYYQEIGRAGRDGKPAEAVLFFRPGDIGAQKYKTGNGKVNTAELQQVTAALVEENAPVDTEELVDKTKLSARKLMNTLHKLEEVGAAEQLATGDVQIASEMSVDEIAEAAAEAQEQQKEQKKRRLEQMKGYAEHRGCRREFLLRYFGDAYDGPCGDCDNCEAAGVKAVAA
jgi:ATP-dependent DNA helicase RecQ